MLKKVRLMAAFLTLFVGLTASFSSVCSTEKSQVRKNYTKKIITASALAVSVAALIWYLNSTGGGEANPDGGETWGEWFRGLGVEFSRALVSAIVVGVAESIFDLVFYGRIRSAAERPTKNIVWLDNGTRFPRVMTL